MIFAVALVRYVSKHTGQGCNQCTAGFATSKHVLSRVARVSQGDNTGYAVNGDFDRVNPTCGVYSLKH